MSFFGFLSLRSDFFRNTTVLFSGALISQIFLVGITPLLSRIYSVSDFGSAAVFLSVFSLVALVSTARYEMAIMLPGEDKEAKELVFLSIFMSLMIASILFLFVNAFTKDISTLLNISGFENWLYLIPIVSLFSGVSQSISCFLNREKKYIGISFGRLLAAFSNGGISIIIGLYFYSVNGLILGAAVSFFIAFIFFLYYFYRLFTLSWFSFYGFFRLLVKYKKFPIINMPSAIFDALRITFIYICISRSYGEEMLGYFFLSYKVLMAPVGLIGGSISQVLFQKVSEMRALSENVGQYIFLVICKIAFFAFPIYFLLYFFSVDIFQLLFGEAWSVSGDVVKAMVLWFFLGFISSPVSMLYTALGRQGSLLVFSGIYLLVPVLLFGFYKFSFIDQLFLLSLCMSAVLFSMIAYLLYVSFENDKRSILEI